MSSKRQLEGLLELRRRLESLVEESMVDGRLDETRAETPGAWSPNADVLETATHFEVKAEVPGVRREDIELRLDGARLDVHGVRRPPGEEANYHRLEGRYGAFRRVFSLTGEVDGAGVEAKLEGGVLCVRIPKRRTGLERREISVDWQGDDD